MMRWIVLSLLALQGQQPEPTYTRADAVRWALHDAKGLQSAEYAGYTRYLALYHIPTRAEREKWVQTVSFVLNSLSRERQIVRPLVVPSTDVTLIRFNLLDYGIDYSAYRRFVTDGSGPADARQHEPYFYLKGEEVDSSGRKRPTLVPDPRLPATEFQQLVVRLQSAVPIVRADWFVYYATLPPAYYDLLGLGRKRADFEDFVFSDVGLAKKARAESAGVAIDSIVASHNRALVRIPTVSGHVGGYYWASFDFRSSAGADDLLLDPLNRKAAAQELIASLRNGLQVYFLNDGQGNRLDKADADIAQDSETRLKDKQVWAGRNCMTCHSQGLRSITDEVRALSQQQIALLVADAEKAKDVRDQFFAIDLAALVKRDQEAYAASVLAATGLDPDANARQLEALLVRFVDTPLSVRDVALEAGVSEAELLATLRRGLGVPAVYTGLLQTPPRPVRRDQHSAHFQELVALLGR